MGGASWFAMEVLIETRLLGKQEKKLQVLPVALVEASSWRVETYGDVIYGLGCNAFNIVNRVQVPASLLVWT